MFAILSFFNIFWKERLVRTMSSKQSRSKARPPCAYARARRTAFRSAALAACCAMFAAFASKARSAFAGGVSRQQKQQRFGAGGQRLVTAAVAQGVSVPAPPLAELAKTL